MIELLTILFRTFRNIKIKLVSLCKIKSIVNMKSYYPELIRKKKIKRYLENIKWVIKNNEANDFYNLHGFDVEKNINQKDYIDYRSFMIERNKKNGLSRPINYVIILRDKFLFERYLSCFGINTAQTIAIIDNSIIKDLHFNTIDSEDIFTKPVFIKSINGECANGVYSVENYAEYQKIEKNFANGRFIIQEKLCQHEGLSKLYDKSINTIRIVTINSNDRIDILAAGLRVGTNKSGNVDNWAAGGLYIEINNDGKLTKNGYAKPIYGGKKEIHPDSNIRFEGYSIPMYDRVKELVINAHKILYGINSIGWDVAITPHGPVLIEGNDNWEISLMQANEGLKKKWNSLIE